MASAVFYVGLAVLLVAHFSEIDAGVRVVRSPHVGGIGLANAQAGFGSYPLQFGGDQRLHRRGSGRGRQNLPQYSSGPGGINQGSFSQCSAGSSASGK